MMLAGLGAISDFHLAVARGKVSGHVAVSQFGHAPDGIQATDTDIWDRADSVPTQQIWVAPTTARIHQLVSDDAGDDGAPAGVGARTVKVYGLTGWGAAEVNETVTMNGTTNVPTSNAYVIIHKLRVITKGATNVNVGTILCTADTDSTVTACILPGNGHSEMAIYGIPSTQKLYMELMDGSMGETGGAAAAIDISLLVNEEPDVELTNFVHEHTFSISKAGSSNAPETFKPPHEIVGPAILKMHGVASSNDQDCHGGFDGILVNN